MRIPSPATTLDWEEFFNQPLIADTTDLFSLIPRFVSTFQYFVPAYPGGHTGSSQKYWVYGKPSDHEGWLEVFVGTAEVEHRGPEDWFHTQFYAGPVTVRDRVSLLVPMKHICGEGNLNEGAENTFEHILLEQAHKSDRKALVKWLDGASKLYLMTTQPGVLVLLDRPTRCTAVLGAVEMNGDSGVTYVFFGDKSFRPTADLDDDEGGQKWFKYKDHPEAKHPDFDPLTDFESLKAYGVGDSQSLSAMQEVNEFLEDRFVMPGELVDAETVWDEDASEDRLNELAKMIAHAAWDLNTESHGIELRFRASEQDGPSAHFDNEDSGYPFDHNKRERCDAYEKLMEEAVDQNNFTGHSWEYNDGPHGRKSSYDCYPTSTYLEVEPPSAHEIAEATVKLIGWLAELGYSDDSTNDLLKKLTT